MHSKRSGQGDESVSMPVRTSDRLRRRPKGYGRPYMYYTQTIMRPKRSKTKTRTAASQIAKMLRPGNRTVQTSNANSVATNLRRSTRKRRISVNLEGFTDSSGTEDNDLMRPKYRSSRNQIDDSVSPDDLLPRREGLRPRRAGLRPRRRKTVAREQLNLEESEDEQEEDTSEEKVVGQDNGNTNNVEENDGEDDDDEGAGDGDREDEGEGEEEEEEDDEEGEEEEQEEGRRRYDLRNRADVVRRLSLEQGKQRARSPRRILQHGMGSKVSSRGDVRRGGSSRVHKRHRLPRAEDSDDSLLVDELDQGPPIPWGSRGGNRSGPPWLLGGLDMHGTTAWGLNVAASGWGHQGGEAFSANSTSGIQTAGPSSKGGADIQPLQVDESVSFDDIGGLSEYVDALKEMVFFPLLYPDFFESYHITPPRGVLLCGPPGTGKTLIARALACAASKAGQKVSFYMRKGADVLSKWVGEAERQLKLLFEEAQRNQPSIIFFDEIDGLAPVRSSKQEQIHNSIVSTLLALMDGLDSRGQVVLIGATNRIDAIDGALRRPGRFDREFNFPLPGYEARAEILEIHTRKWKQPPSKELKLELAASCVGYCGADLKALCTEAAIRAFREKYPQVYTSDDKFLIDVDSVNVEKYHFIEAMSTITPAAHRGSIVQSRPLSSVIAPCLQRHLKKTMSIISDIFPAFELLELSKLSRLSFGSTFPLVYRPRLLICGGEGVGLDHLGPAVLHELEKFPVHSLGLPSLLSDPSAKTPEEALVHIFGEARRTTPSILYLPQFHLWWENAHEQLKAVLRTLLEELPSNFPVLLLGTSAIPLVDLDEEHSHIFPDNNVYQVDKPSSEDRLIFLDRLTEAALSIQSDAVTKDFSHKPNSLPELPKAPKVAAGPKASELKAKAEAESHALRRLRMCLRDVCNRILYDKRFSAFHYPVMDEDAPNYRTIIQNPMDMATLLQHVDSGKYITCKAFLEDFDLILINAKKYNGDDYNGARIVSRAHELRDAVHGMLSQMDPALVAYCEKIEAEGGPVCSLADELLVGLQQQPPNNISNNIDNNNNYINQMGISSTIIRASARLRNVQPEVNLDQSYEALKQRSKKNTDPGHASEEGSRPQESVPVQPKSLSQEQPEIEDSNEHRPGNPHDDVAASDADVAVVQLETLREVESSGPHTTSSSAAQQDDDVTMSDDMADDDQSEKIEKIKKVLLDRTREFGIPQLERLYARVMKGVFETKNNNKQPPGQNNNSNNTNLLKSSILNFLLSFAENEANF